MIDIHCHLLPGLDDGPKSWETTLAMCRLAIEDGIGHIVVTPHANDTYSYNRDHARELVAQLDAKINSQLAFSLGCEFHLSYDNIEDALKHPQRYTIAAKQYLLVELSDYAVPPQIDDGLFHLQACGITPIITHPERNPILQSQPERVLAWVQAGCLIQVTASALTRICGGTAQRFATFLLNEGAVHILATDAHDDQHRKPILSKARDWVGKHFGEDFAQRLVHDNPAAIIAGDPVPHHIPPGEQHQVEMRV